MKNNKYKVLVLSDLSDTSFNVLKSATRIAQVIDGDIELFHVRKSTKVVKRESHLSAVRALKDHYVLVEDRLKMMCDSVHENSEVKATHFFAFGNIKNEIENHIATSKPDIIVLGKRLSKTPEFMGDSILTFVLKNFQGSVMVADNENVLDSESKLNLGLYNSKEVNAKFKYFDALISNSETPIRGYEIAGALTSKNDANEQEQTSVVSYVFEKNDKTMQTMATYMDKNNVNLLFVDRKAENSKREKVFSISEFNTLVHAMKVPVLLMNE
jgi:nucleotide-binding universal stress UspA family protein